MLILWFDRAPVEIIRHWWSVNASPSQSGQPLKDNTHLDAGSVVIVELDQFNYTRARGDFGWAEEREAELWITSAEHYWFAERATMFDWTRGPSRFELCFLLGTELTAGGLTCETCGAGLEIGDIPERGELFWLCGDCGAMYGAEAIFAGQLEV